MSEAVGDRLRKIRLAMGFDKKRHFAQELDVPEDRYDKWETGKATMPPDEAAKLKAKFGITADYLYYGDEATLPRQVYLELNGRALRA